MSKELKAIQVISDKKQDIVVPENGDMAYLVITGVFLDETRKGKLDELSFLPVSKELSDIVIPISTLNSLGCPVQVFQEANIKSENHE